jgi:hypothetical protein
VDDLVRWTRDRVEELLELPWHLPDCQKLKPVPEGLTRTIIGDTFSCNCALQGAMFNQYQAHTAILDRYEEAVQRDEHGTHTSYNSGWVEAWEDAVRAVALAYQHCPGYREEWRP